MLLIVYMLEALNSIEDVLSVSPEKLPISLFIDKYASTINTNEESRQMKFQQELVMLTQPQKKNYIVFL